MAANLATAQVDPRINYSTYLGGSTTTCTNIMAPCVPMPPAVARAMFVAEDGLRNTYVAGFTNETDFPTTAGAYTRASTIVCQTDGSDCVPRNYFLTKFDSAGRLVFSTFLQGGFALSAMTVDGAGNVYLVGSNTNCTYCFRHYTALLQKWTPLGFPVYTYDFDANSPRCPGTDPNDFAFAVVVNSSGKAAYVAGTGSDGGLPA